jgi:carbon-monoxide dehydrogenase medium subunit
MIPAQFDYVAPTSVEDALSALAEHGDDAKILAGGQSLLPVLRMRLNAPEVVIDLGRIDALRGVRDDGDAIVIGAMTQHAAVGSDPLVNEHAALIAKAIEHLADAQVRHRGTFGGALAHADPAGDLGAPALAGQPATEDAVRSAAAQAAEGANPPSDLNGDADYRRHLATVLTRRAVLAAAGG